MSRGVDGAHQKKSGLCHEISEPQRRRVLRGGARLPNARKALSADVVFVRDIVYWAITLAEPLRGVVHAEPRLGTPIGLALFLGVTKSSPPFEPLGYLGASPHHAYSPFRPFA